MINCTVEGRDGIVNAPSQTGLIPPISLPILAILQGRIYHRRDKRFCYFKPLAVSKGTDKKDDQKLLTLPGVLAKRIFRMAISTCRQFDKFL